MSRTNLLAYLAGFIDADGSITIVIARYTSSDGIRKTQYRAKLSACNCKLAPLKLLQRTFGAGKVRLRHWKGKRKRHWKPNYKWIVCNRLATRALSQLLPFLKIKHKQAKHCLTMQALKDSHSSAARRWNPTLNKKCEAQCQKLKTLCNHLNKRGR